MQSNQRRETHFWGCLARASQLLLGATLVLGLTGCGGGGAETGPQGNVLGKIVLRDGSASDLGGVQISMVGGSTVTSDASGAFRLRVAAGRSFRLHIEDPRHPRTEADEDIDEQDDETPDDVDVDADEIDVGELDEDELCEIEVEIDNGEIIVVIVECDDEDGDGVREREGHSRLRPREDDESDARGEVELACGRECCRLEVEVAHLTGPGLFSIFVVDGDTEASLGAFEVNAEGHGRKVIEACNGDDLPFGVDSLAGLSGLLLRIRDADGGIVLRGELPDVQSRDEDGHEGEEGEHGEHGEHEGEGDDDAGEGEEEGGGEEEGERD